MNKLTLIFIILFSTLAGYTQMSPAKSVFIVVLKSNANTDEVLKQHGNSAKNIYTLALKGYSAELTNQEVDELQQDTNVKYVVPDSKMYPQTTQYPVGYTLAMIDQRFLSAPSDLGYDYNFTGQNVNVFVVDSGLLLQHPDFGGRAREGFSIRKGRTDQFQCGGHGTSVAGVVGGTIHGVAKNVNLISVTITQCTVGFAQVSDMIKGLDYVARQQKRGSKTNVVNISYTGLLNTALDDAVRNVVANGSVVVVSAGNDGVDACTQSPSNVNTALTVSGVRQDGYDDGFNNGTTSWTGFNYGTCVDLFAPYMGWTIWYDNSGTMYNDDAYFGGTSFSAPHVTGVVALYLEQHPFANPQEINSAVINNATVGILHINGAGSPNKFVYSLF